MESPAYLIALIEGSPEDFDITALRKSVRRHPENGKIWGLYLQRKVDLARLSSNDVLARELIAELEESKLLIPEFTFHMYSGVAHELISDLKMASLEFANASAVADSTEEKALSLARLGNVKRRMVFGE